MAKSMPNHRTRIGGRLCRALLAATALAVPAAYAASPRKATASEVKDITTRLSTILAGRQEFADAMTATTAQRTLYWSRQDGGTLLVPTFVRFPGATSGYCRLVTLAANSRHPVLIDVPEDVNSPECKGFRDFHYIDVNGDGQPDVVMSITVRSNSFDGYVDVPVVYLSRAEKPGDYCYSSAAAAALEPLEMTSDEKVRKAFERERRRRGQREFTCAGET